MVYFAHPKYPFHFLCYPLFIVPFMFQQPFSFEGRIRRTEYGLSLIMYYTGVGILDLFAEKMPFFGLALLVPLLWFFWAQGAKRCHDRGNSGWFQLIPFYVLWMLFGDSDYGENEYGLNPKGLGNEGHMDDMINQIGSQD